jgi:uncharacterized membrane protein
MQTIFAVHYAHDYYMEVELPLTAQGRLSERLIFPGDRPPTYGEFLYFSFTIGMTFQVSDTDITSRAMRRQVLRHALVSFLFGSVILATTVNVIAGLLNT